MRAKIRGLIDIRQINFSDRLMGFRFTPDSGFGLWPMKKFTLFYLKMNATAFGCR